MRSNFTFLRRYWPSLAEIAAAAEKQLYYDNNACVSKLGTFAELLTEEVLTSEKLSQYIEYTQFDRIDILTNKGIAPRIIADILHRIRMERNEVEHDGGRVTLAKAKKLLGEAHGLAVWFMKTYGSAGFVGHRFVMPAHEARSGGIYVQDKTSGTGRLFDGKYYNINKRASHRKSLFKNTVITLWIIIFLISVSLNIYFINLLISK